MSKRFDFREWKTPSVIVGVLAIVWATFLIPADQTTLGSQVARNILLFLREDAILPWLLLITLLVATGLLGYVAGRKPWQVRKVEIVAVTPKEDRAVVEVTTGKADAPHFSPVAMAVLRFFYVHDNRIATSADIAKYLGDKTIVIQEAVDDLMEAKLADYYIRAGGMMYALTPPGIKLANVQNR